MTHNEIKTLFQYDSWANAKIFDAVSALTDEELSRDLANSHGSILETLIHLVGAVEVWLSRWEGSPRDGMLSLDEVANFEGLRSRWTQIESARDRFVSTLDDEKLNDQHEIRTLSGKPFQHVLWQMMQHVVNHGTYHRGSSAFGLCPPLDRLAAGCGTAGRYDASATRSAASFDGPHSLLPRYESEALNNLRRHANIVDH